MPRERLRAEAEKATNLFIQHAKPFEARTIILFGSYARGDFTEGSDIDLCLIAEKLPRDELARRTMPEIPRIPKVRVIGFHPEEFIQYLQSLRFLAFDIVADGIVVYDDGSYQKIRETYERVLRAHGIRRLSHGWKITKF